MIDLKSFGYPIPHIPKQPMILDTSFWSKACAFNFDPYLWVIYEEPIWITQGVWNEIVTAESRRERIYPDALRMIQCVHSKLIQVFPGYFPVVPNHSGLVDAEVIGLALYIRSTLLIDDLKAYQIAKSLGVKVVTSPNFIALLAGLNLITPKKGLSILHSLQNVTAAELIRPAQEFLESLSRLQEEAAPADETKD